MNVIEQAERSIVQGDRKGIFQALSAVMDDVGAVRKDSKNVSQGFNFRGIDAVVNAASPALRKHGVVVWPNVISVRYETVQVGRNATSMGHCQVQVEYTFAAADGSQITTCVAAESMDSGDKATAKAMSVAFRTALLQTLCLPTDEVDPDAESYERTPKPKPGKKPEAVEPVPEYTVVQTKAAIAGGGLTNAQKGWVERTAGAGALTEVSNILGRAITNLSEVAEHEARAVIAGISGLNNKEEK
jgi:hypothetical protein